MFDAKAGERVEARKWTGLNSQAPQVRSSVRIWSGLAFAERGIIRTAKAEAATPLRNVVNFVAPGIGRHPVEDVGSDGVVPFWQWNDERAAKFKGWQAGSANIRGVEHLLSARRPRRGQPHRIVGARWQSEKRREQAAATARNGVNP